MERLDRLREIEQPPGEDNRAAGDVVVRYQPGVGNSGDGMAKTNLIAYLVGAADESDAYRVFVSFDIHAAIEPWTLCPQDYQNIVSDIVAIYGPERGR